mmetsp:Transcript_22604/g.33286  ORF Transcript_22604/g.33286 Transcript_22604/m.33286 type:complete len:203 (+) Transcript_22604:606-1214(+)
MEKLLRFVTTTTGSCDSSSSSKSSSKKMRMKPYVLLLPHFVYTKPYYTSVFSSSVQPPFFLVPPARYSYVPPSWVSSSSGSTSIQKGKDSTAPFPTFWYCSFSSSSLDSTNKEEKNKVNKWLVQTYGPSGIFTSPSSPCRFFSPKLHDFSRNNLKPAFMKYASCTKHLPYEVQGELDLEKKKRPNPRTRKRMMALKRKQQQR